MKIDLNDYFYFVHVVEKGGYTAAALALGMPKSRLSRHVRQLEDRLNLRLIQRTSRSISITKEGTKFYLHARKLIDAMEMAEASVSNPEGKISGSVSISCSVGVAQFALGELICQFVKDYPDVHIEQHVSNDNIDLVAHGIDLALRGHNAPLPDSSLIQRHIAKVEWHLFASPDHQKINRVNDLSACRYLCMGRQNNKEWLTLEQAGGSSAQIQVSPTICSQDLSTLKLAAIKGLGFTALPAYVCRDELKTGRIVRVLDEWTADRASLSLLMPSRVGLPPQVKALSDYIRAHLPPLVEG